MDGIISEWIEQHPRFSGKELQNFILEATEVDVREAKTLQTAISRKLFQKCLPSISRAELFLTENCNLACDYCFIHGKNNRNKMSFEIARKAVDLLFSEYNRLTKAFILFIGGEPLLEFPLIKEVVHYANQKIKQFNTTKSLAYGMTTNGTLLNREMMSFFRDNKVNLLLSLDGLPACHDAHRKTSLGEGSFWRTANKISLIKEYQPWLATRVTPMPDTVRRLAEGIKFLHELGINEFTIGAAKGGIYWDEERLSELENQLIQIAYYMRRQKELKKPIKISLFEKNEGKTARYSGSWGCQAGSTSITVAPSGKIFPCCKLLGQNNLKGVYQLGTVQKGITYLERRKRLTNFIPVKREKCEVCDIKNDCGGGCYAVNYGSNGSIFNPCPVQCRIDHKHFEISKKGMEILGDFI